jgi:hypothetical protein
MRRIGGRTNEAPADVDKRRPAQQHAQLPTRHSADQEVKSMRPSRREFVTSVTASGIALCLSRLAWAAEPEFSARETLP